MWEDAQWIRIPREELEQKRIVHGDLEAGLRIFAVNRSCRQFTRHAQAWAVLNGMLDAAESRRALRSATDCPPCSFAASYEWFRALEKAGLENEMRDSLDGWIALIGRGSTTCPEEPHHPRSECHAWSALPLYEFTRTMAGVRQESGKIVIRPRMFDLPDLSGTVVTPLGTVRCAYRTDENGTHLYDVSLPEGARGLFITPSGQQIPFTGSLNIME